MVDFLRIALIADIHSNLPALEAVLNAIKKEGIDMVLNAGDIVGYGPFPDQVVDAIMRTHMVSIRGNHDNAVLIGDYSWFNSYAAAAARWTAEVMSRSNIDYLGTLRREESLQVGGRTIGLFHGSPQDPDEYIIEESRAEEVLRSDHHDVVICGHTHRPMEVWLGGRLFFNPGAVGQPRDGNPAASFGIIDLESMEVRTIRIEYDIPAVQKEMLRKGLPHPLASRLSDGF